MRGAVVGVVNDYEEHLTQAKTIELPMNPQI